MHFPSRFSLTFLCLIVSNALVFAEPGKNSKSAENPKPTATQKPAASAKISPTPETKIDEKTEAELLQAEDRFVIGIENRDAKVLEELLHPHFADSIEGGESALTKRAFIAKVSRGGAAAYRIEKERKLTRSGTLFTVEGFARDMFRDGWESRPPEWVRVRRLWEREDNRWITTAQMIAPEAERESDKQKLEDKQ
jgi:hypothetical protein